MRGCIASTIINLIGVFLVVMVVAFLGSTVFAQLPWRVTSQEAADTIQYYDFLDELDDIEYLPNIDTYVRVEVVSELTPWAALTNSVLLAVMTATFCAVIFIVILFVVAYGGYNLIQGVVTMSSFIETTPVMIIAGFGAMFLGPLAIWFTLLFQAGSPLYYVLWVVVGLPALLLGYSGIYYGTVVARWIGKQVLGIFSFANIFTNSNTQIGGGLIILAALALFFIFLGQLDWPRNIPNPLGPDNENGQATAPPDDCQYLDYDTVITNRLAFGQEDSYCFTGEAGTSIAIRVAEQITSEEFTLGPSLTLYRPDGRVTDQNNVEGGLSYVQALHNPTQNGVYWFRVVGSPTGGSGQYGVLLERGPKAGMADVNQDCRVDDTDMQLIIDAMGTRGNPDLDLDLSGSVNARDIALFQYQRLTECR